MPNHRCPHCKTPIRGVLVFKARAAKSAAPKGGCRCPGCGALLVLLTNWWQVSGLLVVLVTITLRLILDRSEFPSLWMALAVCTLAGFAMSLVGILYFPRYASIQERETDE